jgi:hypothetical protein
VPAALAYLEKAESVAPDALIAIPPTEAKSLDDFREYYRGLAGATRRPLFIQTTGVPALRVREGGASARHRADAGASKGCGLI